MKIVCALNRILVLKGMLLTIQANGFWNPVLAAEQKSKQLCFFFFFLYYMLKLPSKILIE